MGRWIDRWALRAALSAGAYLLFLNAWGSVPLAGGLTLACAALLGVGLRGRKPARRLRIAGARTALSALAAMPEAEAEAALAALVRARWPGEDFRLRALLKHPSAGAGANDVFALWKANRDAERLVIAATCSVDAKAMACARSLSNPDVAVLDDRALRRLLAAEPDRAAAESPLRRLRRQLRSVPVWLARPASPRFIPLGLTMLALYLRLGHPLYLFGGLWIAFRLGSALAAGGLRRRLFG